MPKDNYDPEGNQSTMDSSPLYYSTIPFFSSGFCIQTLSQTEELPAPSSPLRCAS